MVVIPGSWVSEMPSLGQSIQSLKRAGKSNKLPCDRKSLHYSNYFPGINFDIALHSLYRNYFSPEIVLLYIALS